LLVSIRKSGENTGVQKCVNDITEKKKGRLRQRKEGRKERRKKGRKEESGEGGRKEEEEGKRKGKGKDLFNVHENFSNPATCM
jgi:hypothetical protein